MNGGHEELREFTKRRGKGAALSERRQEPEESEEQEESVSE